MAFHISRHLHLAGHQVCSIWSRTYEHALTVAAECGSVAVEKSEDLPADADFYLLTVPDDAIADMAERFSGWNGTWLHTAGAVSMDVLSGKFKAFGVLYPLQTLSSSRQLSLNDTPFLVEGSSPAVSQRIQNLALTISDRVVEMDSLARLKVHLAAVFANNFSNHMFTIAARIMDESGNDFSLLAPLLRETFLKVAQGDPVMAQTGPALRGDTKSMKKHLELLRGEPELENLYTFVSRDIEQSHKPSKERKSGD